MVVSRWLVMPTAASRGDQLGLAQRGLDDRPVRSQISVLCSTQPAAQDLLVLQLVAVTSCRRGRTP